MGNFKFVGNQVDRPTRNERLLRALRLVAKSAGISTRRVAASSVGNTGRLGLITVASLALATHSLATKLLLLLSTTLTVVCRLLHLVSLLLLAWVTHLWVLGLLWPHELIPTLGLVWRWAALLVAIWLLLGILIVWVLHDV